MLSLIETTEMLSYTRISGRCWNNAIRGENKIRSGDSEPNDIWVSA